MAGCCDPRGPKVYKIKVGNNTIGITGLDVIIKEVRSMDLATEEEIKEELFKRAQSYNYIPDSAREKYADALYKEYLETQ